MGSQFFEPRTYLFFILIALPSTHHEFDATDVQVPQDVAHGGVFSAVVWQAQLPVGIDCVQAILLQ